VEAALSADFPTALAASVFDGIKARARRLYER
jgi:hypothetical protein